MLFESARLDDDHVLEGFDCGKPALNAWLLESAHRANTSGVAHVYVRGITAGRLTADLDFDGTAADLAAALERAGYTVRSLSSEAVAL